MKNKYSVLTIIGLILGIIFGMIFPNLMKNISFIGTIYINLLKFLIIPIIFTSIMTTIYKHGKNKGKTIISSIVLFTCMFIITFLLTSLIVWIFKPGMYFSYESVKWTGEISDLKIADIIVNLFPSNISTMIQNNSIFSILIVSFFSGIAARNVKNGKEVINVIEGIKNISFKLLEYVMLLTPIAVFCLIGNTIALNGSNIIEMGVIYIGFAYICSIITMLLIMILPVWIYTGLNPFVYIKKILKVWLMTITTCSSSATLPTTLKVCNEDLNISNDLTDVVVPLGCTIHMCGGAVSFALLGLFCTQLFGIEVSLITYLLMLISATLLNMSAPGIPNGGVVIGATYLSMLGIPLGFIGFYSGIYKILDMSYTTLNVTGDITANLLLNRYLSNKNNDIL